MTRTKDSLKKKKRKKKGTCRIADSVVPAKHRIKLKENEKSNKYQDFAKEPPKIWYIKVTVISIVIGELGTVTKELVQGVEDLEKGERWETIQTTALRSVRILRGVLET